MQDREDVLEQIESLPDEVRGDAGTKAAIQAVPKPALAPDESTRRSRGLFRRFGQWVAGMIVQDVPDDSALCAFDCQKTQCTTEEWAHCERRLSRAAGELWPEVEPQRSSQASAAESRNHGPAIAEGRSSGSADHVVTSQPD